MIVYTVAKKKTLEHLFWQCDTAKCFWNDLDQFLKQKMETEYVKLSCSSIMFGLPNQTTVLNHLILIGKYQLYACRYTKVKLTRNSFLQKVKEVITIERKILKDEKFNTKWCRFLHLIK